MKISRTGASTLLALALLAGCLGCGSDSPEPAGAIRLPDGEIYEIPAMEFDRPTLRDAEGLDKQWQEAGAAYRTGNYRRSAKLFGRIVESESRDPERHDAALYAGIALLREGRTADARVELERARGLAGATGLDDSAETFYLGLTSLAENDVEAATRALQAALGGPFDREARALLARLTGATDVSLLLRD